MSVLLIIFGLLSDCFLSVLVGLVGSRRNIGFGWAFILSLIFTPLIGLLFTLISRERPYTEKNKYGCIGTILAILGLLFLIFFILGAIGIIGTATA